MTSIKLRSITAQEMRQRYGHLYTCFEHCTEPPPGYKIVDAGTDTDLSEVTDIMVAYGHYSSPGKWSRLGKGSPWCYPNKIPVAVQDRYFGPQIELHEDEGG